MILSPNKLGCKIFFPPLSQALWSKINSYNILFPKVKQRKHNIIISWVISSHICPMYIETRYITLYIETPYTTMYFETPYITMYFETPYITMYIETPYITVYIETPYIMPWGWEIVFTVDIYIFVSCLRRYLFPRYYQIQIIFNRSIWPVDGTATQVRVELEVVAMKGYSIFPRAPELKRDYQIQSNVLKKRNFTKGFGNKMHCL